MYAMVVLQDGKLRIIGKYAAMSVIQGGSGFPFLALPVYQYIVTGKCANITLGKGAAPDNFLQLMIEKVTTQTCYM